MCKRPKDLEPPRAGRSHVRMRVLRASLKDLKNNAKSKRKKLPLLGLLDGVCVRASSQSGEGANTSERCGQLCLGELLQGLGKPSGLSPGFCILINGKCPCEIPCCARWCKPHPILLNPVVGKRREDCSGMNAGVGLVIV